MDTAYPALPKTIEGSNVNFIEKLLILHDVLNALQLCGNCHYSRQAQSICLCDQEEAFQGNLKEMAAYRMSYAYGTVQFAPPLLPGQADKRQLFHTLGREFHCHKSLRMYIKQEQTGFSLRCLGRKAAVRRNWTCFQLLVAPKLGHWTYSIRYTRWKMAINTVLPCQADLGIWAGPSQSAN